MRWTWALFVLLPTLAWGHAGVPFGLQPYVEDGELVMGGGTTGFIHVEEGVATWTCEDAFFLQPNFWHPTAGGRLLAGTAYGLRGSTDRGCTWSDVTKLGNQFFSSLEVDPADPDRVWLVTGTQGATNTVYRSVDDAVNWEVVREDDTVDFREIRASDDGAALFLVGRRQGDRFGVLWRSDDGGDTWSAPLVLEGWEAVDLLTVSEDGGTLYLSAVAEKGGFWLIEVDAALTTPALGISDWYSPPTSATELDGHLFVSVGSERLMVRGPSSDFVEIPEQPLSCLDRIDGVLWACSFPPNFPQYLFSEDLGETWQTALDFSDVVRRDCPVGTAGADVCPEVWERLQALQIQLGDDDDDDVTPDDDDTTIFFDDDDDDDDASSDCNGCGGSADPAQAAFLLLLPLVRRRSR
jgi:hypothetical protein